MKKPKHNIGDLVAVIEGFPNEVITGLITTCSCLPLENFIFKKRWVYEITWCDNRKNVYSSEQIDVYKETLAGLI